MIEDHPHPSPLATPSPLKGEGALSLIQLALAEDFGAGPNGDITTIALVDASHQATAHFVNRKPGVVAGLEIIGQVFAALESLPSPLGGGCPEGAGEGLVSLDTPLPSCSLHSQATLSLIGRGNVNVEYHVADGDYAGVQTNLCTVSGSAAAILTAERTALNFLCHLSGVATATYELQQLINHTSAKVCDTRKTTPGWRALEKYAVRMGGGANHRMGLYDMVMIKDNHLAALINEGRGDISAAVAKARAAAPGVPVAVEVENLDQLRAALMAKADRIMLDNMKVDAMRQAVVIADGRAAIEATGGVTAASIVEIAETGVDFISVGAITHSAPVLDIGLDFE